MGGREEGRGGWGGGGGEGGGKNPPRLFEGRCDVTDGTITPPGQGAVILVMGTIPGR